MPDLEPTTSGRQALGHDHHPGVIQMEVAAYDAHHAVDLLNRAILRHKHQAWAGTGYPSSSCKTPTAELVARQELNGWGWLPAVPKRVVRRP